MPSMSYCMYENASEEMDQVVEDMMDQSSIQDMDLSSYEEAGFEKLYTLCQSYIEEYERLKNM